MDTTFVLPEIDVIEIPNVNTFNVSQPQEDRTPWKDYAAG